VIEDPINPENNGKVFLYSYGSTIYDRLMDKLTPKFESEIAMNAFDLVEGAAFKLKGAYKTEDSKKSAQDKNKEYSYAASEFLPVSDMTTMPNIDEILEQRFDLMALIDPTLFKPYDELAETLDKTLQGKSYKRKEEGADEETDEDEKDLAAALKIAQDKKAAKKAAAKLPAPVVEEETEDEDDDINDDFMKRLEKLSS
jgi:hypothetical protein